MEQPQTERYFFSDQPTVCKFCLDPCSELAPCNCAGSVRYVHSACLAKWFSICNRLERIGGNSYRYECETCKSPIYLSMDYKYEWRCDCRKCKREAGRIVCLVLIALILMGCIGFCLASIIWKMCTSQRNRSEGVEFIIGFIFLPLASILLLVMVKHLIFEYICTVQKHNIKLQLTRK